MATVTGKPEGTMLDVKNFFGYTSASSFAADWKKLSDVDKKQLKAGIADGTLDY